MQRWSSKWQKRWHALTNFRHGCLHHGDGAYRVEKQLQLRRQRAYARLGFSPRRRLRVSAVAVVAFQHRVLAANTSPKQHVSKR